MTLRTTMKLKEAMLLKTEEQYPQFVPIAKRNIETTKQRISGEIELKYLENWNKALSDKEALKRMIADTSDEGMSHWQLAPFAGIFTPEERWLILRKESSR